jgi:hypothetical protein
LFKSFIALDADWRYEIPLRYLLNTLKSMRALFSSLVACALLMHAAVGCGWHHKHDAIGDNAVAVADSASECCHHSHHEGDHQEHGQPSQAPCDGHSHCQGLCNYLPVQKPQLDQSSVQLLPDFAVIAPATSKLHVESLTSFARAWESASEPPLRLHLLHQILLI